MRNEIRGTRRSGFSFLELFVGIVILFFGIIPIFWVMSGSTRAARLTVQQVQATNHATNLLEAVRAAGFDAVSRFPPIMEQIGTAPWHPPDDTSSMDWAGSPGGPVTDDQLQAFESFTNAFFGKDYPVVPEMEDFYKRYLVVRGTGGGGPAGEEGSGGPRREAMLGVIVRVEWVVVQKSGDTETERPQNVELRTVFGDPYRSLGGGQ